MVDKSYQRAPITEALIDLQVEFASLPTQSQFEACASHFAQTFPGVMPIHQFEVNFGRDGQIANRDQFESGPAAVGVRVSNEKGNRVVQLQRRGFTFSYLPPYTNWAEFRGETKGLWSGFVEDLKPKAVTRVAVRNINRIVVPATSADFGVYFNLNPKLPENISQFVSGCFMQLILPQLDITSDAAAALNFALEPSATPGNLSFLLDIDVYCTCQFEPESGDIWLLLDKLRDRKNELFEACITDEARKLFQ